MNNDAANDTTGQPVTLNNESNPDTGVFSVATSAIVPDSHLLSSGIKLDTELFSKGNTNNMADKDTIDTTPVPKAPDTNTPDFAAQYAGSTESNYPYSLENCKFSPYSTKYHENQKKRENKIDDKVKMDTPPPCPRRHQY